MSTPGSLRNMEVQLHYNYTLVFMYLWAIYKDMAHVKMMDQAKCFTLDHEVKRVIRCSSAP